MVRGGKTHIVRFLILLLLTARAGYVLPQADSLDVYRFNLMELSNLSVVTVSKTPQEARKSPANVQVVTAQEIKEGGYFTLDQVLANLPGFQFRNTLGFNSYIFQRGIPSQNNLILVLVNGVQVNELNSGGFYGGAQYNLDNVDRIEVVYGAASVVYGTNAISGVINIITKDNKGLQGSVLTGGFNTFGASLSAGGEKNGLGISLAAMYKTSQKAELSGAAGDFNWSNQMENFENDYSVDLKMKFKGFKVGINYMNKQSSRTTNYKSTGTTYQDFGTLWNISFANAYVNYSHQFGENLILSTSLYNRNAIVMDNTVGMIKDSSQTGYYRPNFLFGNENLMVYNHKNKLKLISGLSLQYEELASGFSKTYSGSLSERPAKPPKPPMVQNGLMSVFMRSDYTLLPPLLVVAGFRFDYSTYYDKVATPKVGLIFNYRKLTSKLLYTEAYRAPRPWDFTSGIGNPELKPEKIRSFEFSNNLYFSRNLILAITLYNNKLSQAFVKSNVDSLNSYHWINLGKIETDGLEIWTRYSVGSWNFYANYTFNYSLDENKVEVAEIAKHTANAGFTYRFRDLCVLNLRMNYYGRRKNPVSITTTGSNYVDAAVVLDGSLSFVKFKNIDFQLIANNILNAEYYHTSNRPPERYRQPQQNFMLKLNYKFDDK
ncbi:MAG: TonB-dependent receptor [Chlorobi bacterium]|nr:TonB-dependent receptor [Chlorobiota bacterium]